MDDRYRARMQSRRRTQGAVDDIAPRLDYRTGSHAPMAWRALCDGTIAPMLRARHLFRLGGEFVAYAVVNRVWWLIPLMLLLTIATLVVVVGQAAAPVSIYPLF